MTPTAVGEVFNSIWDCKQLIDNIRTSITPSGGITGLRRIANLASLYQVRTGSNGPSDLTPICMPAALVSPAWRIGLLGFSGETCTATQQSLTSQELSLFTSRLNSQRLPGVIAGWSRG